MNISVITTFHKPGLDQYAQRMIDTFSKNWPKEVKLFLYPENCEPVVRDSSRTVVKKLETVENLTRFKERWRSVPKANGDISADPRLNRRKDAKKSFKWDAIRFAHKVFAIFDCAEQLQDEILLWMDADMVCHSPITIEQIKNLCPEDKDLCYLGRSGKYSECGLYAMNLSSMTTRNFLKEFQRVYEDADNGIFLMDEWHDSFVFDQVRTRFPSLKSLNWSESLVDLRPSERNSKGEGHPLINCEWGAYLDHLKGDRKAAGRSYLKDLKEDRKEIYWK